MNKFRNGFLCGALGCTGMILALTLLLQMTGHIDLSAVVIKSNEEISTKQRIEKKANTIKEYIDEFFLDDIDMVRLEDSIYKGIVDGLGDEYAAYYSADEYADIMEKTSGKYYGIGAYVKQDSQTGAITVVNPMANGPAEKAGIKAGDIIYAVEGTEITGKDLSSVLALIKGEKGTKVTLKILRSGEADYLDIGVIREEIEEDTVSYRMLNKEIGYLQVTGFEEVTTKQFSEGLEALEKQNMKGLVLDLRDNGGGLLKTAVEMLDRMLPEGLVVYTEDSKGQGEKYYAEDDTQINVPVAILVNGNSASASEVFSGAMQDEEKAVLVGTKTFGKGIVQTIFDLKDGSALKMTTSKYYTPKGRNIHGTGLEPDITVELDRESLNKKDSNGEWLPDNQMERAMEYLESEI
ncbi:MAG: S41 family peptidase [Lachnospiraceae bacterium]|nr:S41 family peptidase [Lachnospiraceae bacterium]